MSRTYSLVLLIIVLVSATSCDGPKNTKNVIPAAATGAYERGKAAIEAGDYETAINELTEALRFAPNHPEILLDRACVYLELKNYSESMKDIESALLHGSKSLHQQRLASCYYIRASCRYHTGQVEESVKDYDEALWLAPAISYHWQCRARAYYDLGDYDKAIEDYNKAIQLEPNDTLSLFNRGLTRCTIGDELNIAIQDFTRVIEIEPTRYDAYALRGDAYCQLNELELAETDLLKAIENEPNSSNPFYSLGCVRQKQNRFDESIELLTNSLELLPDDPEALLKRSQSYYMTSQYVEAIADLDRVQQLEPDYPMQYVSRAKILLRLDQDNKAIEAYQNAISHFSEPSDQAICYSRISDIYYYSDDLENSLDCLNKAIELDPTESDYYADRALVYEELGNNELAEQDRKKAAELEQP